MVKVHMLNLHYMTFKLCGVSALDKATMDPHGLQPRLPTMDLYRLQPTDPVFDMHQTGAIDKGIEDEIFTSSEVSYNIF